MPNSFFTRRYDKAIFALAMPALGALAADPLVSLVDTAFVGRLGALELAALGVNTSIFSLAFFVFNFLAYGTTPMISRALGQKNPQAAGRTIIQALSMALILGIIALSILELFAPVILGVMGAEGELREPALAYLRVRALAGPAVLFITAGNGVFRGFQNTLTPMVITLWLNAINLVLDPLFMFVFDWGLVGAALATVIAQWCGALWFLWLLLVRERERFHVPLVFPAWREFTPFLRIGWELLLRTLSLMLTLTLATAVATRVGVVEVAAHQVASQLWLFLALVVDALAIAAQALVARYLGEGNQVEARGAANRLLFLGVWVGVGLSAVFWVLRPLLARLFTDDPAVIAVVMGLFPFIALMQPLNALVFVWDGVFMGAEDFRYLAFAMMSAAAVASIVLLLVVPLGLGLAGVWWAIVLLMLLRAVTLGVRYFNPQESVFYKNT